MTSTLNEYLRHIANKLATDMASEHAYRPLLESSLKCRLTDNFEVINDGKRIGCGQPDLVIYRKVGKNFIDIGYVEAKDIGVDLDKEEKSDQLKRYRESLENLILTDYLEFRFFVHGHKVASVRIADYKNGTLTPIAENFNKLEDLLSNFFEYTGQEIKSSKKLAAMMAKKAKLMKEVFYKAVIQDDENNSLREQHDAFKKILIHDLTYEQFADIYAQTITYGLFTARIHDNTPEDFSRQEARELIPKSNPFLRQLFDYISGANLDHRVVWIVDALCELLRLVHKENILTEFSSKNGQQDPIIHFYETFLAEYDPKLRKSRGVWYTPEPVVNFIVRAIDDCLKKYFNLPDGLASKDKIKIKVDEQAFDRRTKSGKSQKEIEVHKVQLLDVATGTGTFLAEIIRQIYKANFENQRGMWSSYVEEHLLPRLHGFEILMTSYAMCHLKIDLLLEQLGYKAKDPNNPKRLSVYLTNSLEEAHPDTGTLFASWLSNEATKANYIKRDMPIMVAFGNPPYSVSSSNKGEWIQELIKAYKTGLNEKKLNLDDDYIKFIRYAEHYIEKTGSGIVAMITNNSFIDGVTHRQMRKHLAETFDAIYIYDLHGSAKKKETAPNGSKDENVFDIQQGVSISIFIKYKQGKEAKQLAKVFHYDAYGKREVKYENLWNNSLLTTGFQKLEYKEPYYFFVPKSFEEENSYIKGFKIDELFKVYSSGIETKNDRICISEKSQELEDKIYDIKNLDEASFYNKYNLEKTVWNFDLAKRDLDNCSEREICYRLFDNRRIYYSSNSSGFLGRPRNKVMKHFFQQNFGLITSKQANLGFKHSFITENIVEGNVISSSKLFGAGMLFPLYLYYSDVSSETNREPNLNDEIVEQVSEKLALLFVPDHTDTNADGKTAFSPLDLLDYIYAVLHSPSYRERYKEFLKIEFPRIPYPENLTIFWELVVLGKRLRELHLLESPFLKTLITSWNVDGDNLVEKPMYKDGMVYINKEQYFEGVPEIAWNFYIGGYQPAQKWLKDRKGRKLSYDDLEHYQKIIVALFETHRLMSEIDAVWKKLH